VADELILTLMWFRQTHPREFFFTVVGRRDDIYNLLAPWGFSGDPYAGGPEPDHYALISSFDAAVTWWRAEPYGRAERRRLASIAGQYIRPISTGEREAEAAQLLTSELPDRSVYIGPAGDLASARSQAEARVILSKIEGIASSGPFATLGRVVGAMGAWLGSQVGWGTDVQTGAERGAAIGALGDVLLPIAAACRIIGKSNLWSPIANRTIEAELASNRATTARQAIRVPETGTIGNRSASVDASVERLQEGPALSPQKTAMVQELRKEHPQLNATVAEDAVRDASRVAGKGGPGADVILANGRGREVSVHTGAFTIESIKEHLINEVRQVGTREIYLQINSASASREGLMQMIFTLRRAADDLDGVYVKFFGPTGGAWWSGTFYGARVK
jgi:hypothetical protein